MHYHYPMMIVNTVVMIIIMVTGIIRFRRMDHGLKIFYLINCVSLLGETTAYICAIYLRTNLLAYAILNLVEIFMFCMYFNYTVDYFKKFSIGFFIAIPSVLFGFYNLINYGNKGNINVYFMMYMAFIIIAMSMASLSEGIIKFSTSRQHMPQHVWIPVVLTIFWTSLFLNWGLYDYFSATIKNKWIIDFTIFLINILANISYMVVFLIFPKTTGPR